MKKLLFIMITLCISGPLILAESPKLNPEYENIKGDFKIVCLGDSRKTVTAKMAYLQYVKHEVSGSMPFGYTAPVFGYRPNIHFQFVNDKLVKISFDFSLSGGNLVEYYDELKTLHNKLKRMFTDLYGAPTIETQFPVIDYSDAQKVNYTGVWVTETGKWITIQVVKGYIFKNLISDKEWSFMDLSLYVSDHDIRKPEPTQAPTELEKQTEQFGKDF